LKGIGLGPAVNASMGAWARLPASHSPKPDTLLQFTA